MVGYVKSWDINWWLIINRNNSSSLTSYRLFKLVVVCYSRQIYTELLMCPTFKFGAYQISVKMVVRRSKRESSFPNLPKKL